MSGKLFFSGNRLTQAVLSAARHFHLDPDQVAYTERTKSSGFLGSPRVVIEVDPAAPKRAASAVAVAVPVAQTTAAAGVLAVLRPPVLPSRPPVSRLSEARERELRELATAAVEAVRASGEALLLSEMNPAERRIIHTTVSELGLATESQGEERYKRILVRLGQV
jgi:R3H domain-containing protein